MRPVRHSPHMPMFDRVVMNVIHVTTQIDVVTDQMLPITTLPNTAFAADDPPITAPLLYRQATRKARFYLRPTICVVGIADRQALDTMQMIRQHHDRQQLERPNRMRRAE